MGRNLRSATQLLVMVGLVGGSVAVLGSVGEADEPDTGRARAQAASPRAEAPRRPRRAPALAGLDPREHRRQGDVLVADLVEGRTATLTLDPELQEFTAGVLERYDVPYGAVVAIEPSTGRVLAYVSHSSANPEAGDLVLDPTPPTASVFKVITTTALIDAGVSPTERVCYNGGSSRLTLANLENDPARDRRCATLTEALGGSINSVFAKLADQRLDVPTLERYAAAFGFGHALPFDIPTRPSPAEVPTDRLEFARTSAGFWHMHMSPLHGALIASTIANEGRMPRAAIVDHVVDANGDELYRHEPSIFRAVVPARTARLTGEMMERTVTHGTGRRTFRDPAGVAFLPGIRVAGKTGTLSGENPYRGYTWFVGFAPAEAPTIAVAALIVNTPRWRIKATYAARETLRYYLVEAPRRRAAQERRDAAAAAAAAESGSDG